MFPSRFRIPLQSLEIAAQISSVWRARQDRGAELRLAQRDRGVFVPLEQLRQDPHLEMHTRGG